MRSELDVLLDKIADPILRADIQSQVDRIRAKRTFGLVFESHLPERVRLPEHEIRVGVRVAYRDDAASAAFEVTEIRKQTATLRRVRNPDGSVLSAAQQADVVDETAAFDALVVIADFGDPVFPGLRHLGSISRGGDKPSHVVIKGENHHVLEALQFTHSGKVDCIYIDPPYNTGARDWKYDNNYVDDTDAYRHSKWLAFMERRLVLAKQLLKPDDSVLIVTIDEKEYLRLGLLLDRVFPAVRKQMVSITISPRGTSRANEFSRVDEFAFIVYFGGARLFAASGDASSAPQARWQYLRRDERTSTRAAGRPNQFFPIYVSEASGRIEHVGEPIRQSTNRNSVRSRKGCATIFPIQDDGTEMVWGLTAPSLRKILADGFVRVTAGTNRFQRYNITYLRGVYKNLNSGKWKVVGERHDGSKSVVVPGGAVSRPTTVWRDRAHDAGAYGTSLLGALVPNREFPYPKSLYAVEDMLRYFLKGKPQAVVLDFFAGSGTTAHAVARLNHEDNGRRQSISVTNNEVSAAEADTLSSLSLRPGDPEWEALGIFEHITRPRIEAAITGRRYDGEPIEGAYRFGDEFPMSDGLNENVEFLELTYLDPETIELDAAFNSVAPLLWLRAGGRGSILSEDLDPAGRRKPYDWTDRYGVLFNPDRWRTFIRRSPVTVSTVFIVTDSQTTFSGIASELPSGLDVVRLYENYLSTFTINGGYL
jgi:adenine-specific DNA-methyltransferase